MQVVNPIRNDAVKDALPNPPPKSVTLKDPVLARFCLVEKLNDEASIESTVETEAVCSPTVMLKRRDLRTLSELLPISAESECHREKRDKHYCSYVTCSIEEDATVFKVASSS